jgi:hypothetical protein
MLAAVSHHVGPLAHVALGCILTAELVIASISKLHPIKLSNQIESNVDF